VFAYAAGGYYYPGKGVDALRAEMHSYLERGYTVVKMKIGGASIVRVENGHITMPDLPGIGFEGKADLYAEMRRLSS